MRKPSWIRSSLICGPKYHQVQQTLKKEALQTVCQSALCPNRAECWDKKTATLMILGSLCTRNCRFCAVPTGNPQQQIDTHEIESVAELARSLELNYLVITSVDRDDLEDHGSAHFAAVIRHLKEQMPLLKVEVLIPDFSGDEEAIKRIVDARPLVIGHNIETIERLTPTVRDRRASYHQSLDVLAKCKIYNPQIATKSSIMVGLGETLEEIYLCLRDLRSVGVDILTIGQYLRPSAKHLPVVEYYRPHDFETMRQMALEMGFDHVVAGPMVRSSYRAEEYLTKAQNGGLQ